LLSNGDVPKEAWINPKGGHLGRQVKVYPDPVILRTVIVPWLVRKLGMEDAPKAADGRARPSAQSRTARGSSGATARRGSRTAAG